LRNIKYDLFCVAEPPTPTYYYAVTKVAAEQAASMVSNHAIIRLDFFPLTKLKYSRVLSDHYTSKLPVTQAAANILRIAESNFVGVINIGQGRDTLYNILKPYYPAIEPIKIKDSPMPDFPKDISLDLSKWKRIFGQ
jgi:dTDP-4-dehydrorhamnose reductase